jgi:GNAT superfamily N-acetyltransferase
MFEEYHHDGFSVSTDPARLDIDAIHDFLARESYWASGRTREIVERALAHSLCFGLYDGQRQIGLARMITDYATYAYVDDVYVLAEYRGRGLATWLLGCVLDHPSLQSVRRITLHTRDAQGFYGRFGFAPARFPDRYMERVAPDFYTAMPQ